LVNKIGASTTPARYDAANASGKDTPLATTTEDDLEGNAVLAIAAAVAYRSGPCTRTKLHEPTAAVALPPMPTGTATAQPKTAIAVAQRRLRIKIPHLAKHSYDDHLVRPRLWEQNLNGKRVTPGRRAGV
jgi:hypothetical protein